MSWNGWVTSSDAPIRPIGAPSWFFPTTHGAATGRRHRQSCRRNRTTLKSVPTEQRFDDMCATMQGLLTALELQANGPDA